MTRQSATSVATVGAFVLAAILAFHDHPLLALLLAFIFGGLQIAAADSLIE